VTGSALPIGTSQVFILLFLMLGPLKLLGPFAQATANFDDAERRSLALRAALVSTLTVIAASLIGSAMLEKWNVSAGALAIAGGILFFSVAFSMVLAPYSEHELAPAPPGPAPTSVVVMRRIVPAIVSPYGIAALVLILTLAPNRTPYVIAALLAIMLLDLLAMLYARSILAVAALPLQIFGTVVGVLQVALSVQMIVYGIGLIAQQKFGVHIPG
jgi:multiple antibiotic resistance protein